MRFVLRSQVRAASVQVAASGAGSDGRRAWIEALFGDHLPRTQAARNRAIETLASDGQVWKLLHQARHSMAETSATIERLARAALESDAGENGPLRAA